MRDGRKSAEYFEAYLAYEQNSINEFKDILKEIIPVRGEEDSGVKSGFLSLYSFHFNMLNGTYSSGGSLEEIEKMMSDITDVIDWNYAK